MLLRHQAEPALGGERQSTGVTPNLSHHESQIAAAQPFFQREQRILRRGSGNMDQPVAQRARQAGAIGPSSLAQGRPILHPQPRPLIPCHSALICQGQGKGRRGTVLRAAEQFDMGSSASSGSKRGRQHRSSGWESGNHPNRTFLFLLCSDLQDWQGELRQSSPPYPLPPH